MDEERKLLAKLKNKQVALGLSDREMALRLGISRELWNKTRLGKNRIKARALHGIVRAFPELIPECLDFLRSNGTIRPVYGSIVPQAEVAS